MRSKNQTVSGSEIGSEIIKSKQKKKKTSVPQGEINQLKKISPR